MTENSILTIEYLEFAWPGKRDQIMRIQEIKDNWFRTGRILACEIDDCINNSVGYVQLNAGEDELQEDGQIVWLCQRHFSGVLRQSIKEAGVMPHVDGPLFNG